MIVAFQEIFRHMWETDIDKIPLVWFRRTDCLSAFIADLTKEALFTAGPRSLAWSEEPDLNWTFA